MVHMKTVCFQDPISIPDYHARFQNYSAIYLLPVLWFMCQCRAYFHVRFQHYCAIDIVKVEHICLNVFLGWLSKNGHEIVNNWLRPLYHTYFDARYRTAFQEKHLLGRSLMIGWRKKSWNPERVPSVVTLSVCLCVCVSVCLCAGYRAHLLT